MTTTTSNRFLLDVALTPVQGSRFAPTGFADLGAAVFDRPVGDDGWVQCLIVESSQSMANRLEGTVWDDGDRAPAEVVAGLPYFRVVDAEGNHLTSSREESHRLASSYIRPATVLATGSGVAKTGTDVIVEVLGLEEGAPHDHRKLALAVFRLDPLALIHGVFFAGKGAKEFPGQPKFTRLLTAFIEATDVRRAESGGVKRDHVNHTQKASGGDSSDGYGSIPFARTEWTARHIIASFNLDLAQLRSYGLPEAAEQLLEAIARLEIATLLAQPLRLRTNCDLELAGGIPEARGGGQLGTVQALTADVRRLIAACGDEGLLGTMVELEWVPGPGRAKAATS